MNVFALKLRLLVLLMFGCSFFVKGQNFRFIYIQTENKQPFYVKMDKKHLSSSASGYIIISKLTEGSYKLVIGSPLNEWGELNVTVNVKDANTGYLLKRSGDKNWNLVNLQTQALIAAEQKPAPVKNTEIISEGDGFAKMLAEVVNDPSIGQVITVKNETAVIVATVDKTTVIPGAVPPPKAEPAKSLEKEKVVPVSKLAKDSTGSGLLLTYLDKSGSVNDTVKLFIPVTEPVALATKEKKSAKPESRFIDMELQDPNIMTDSDVVKKTELPITEKKTSANPSAATEPDTKTLVLNTSKATTNSNCKKEGTQNDFLKLRKQMAAAESEREMTKTAGRQFVLTCFTTEQIRNLGLLYITEDERYKFYVAAFPYVADIQNFAALEDQLTDIYYKTRFKAMLSNKNALKD